MTIRAAGGEAASLWVPPVQRTVATSGTGVAELVEAIDRHAQHLRQSGDWGRRERARLEVELETLVRETLVKRFRSNIPGARYDEMVERMVRRELSPWEAVKELLG
jgi:LAO/AO transport system kinase